VTDILVFVGKLSLSARLAVNSAAVVSVSSWTDSTDSPDRLLILPRLSVFYFLFFLFVSHSVVGSVR